MITKSEKQIRVLHVEDDENDVELFHRAILRTCPRCQIEEAAHPEIALRKLAESTTPPHAVITDSSFQNGMGAEDFIRTLRQRYPRIPVFALSGHREAAMVNRAYDAGVSAYFVKPPTFDQLVRTVTVLTAFLELCELPS